MTKSMTVEEFKERMERVVREIKERYREHPYQRALYLPWKEEGIE